MVVFLGFVCIWSAEAATIDVTSSTNWSTLTGGSGTGGLPNTSDTVMVRSGATLTVDSSSATCGILQVGGQNVGGAGTLTFSGTSPSLTVSGDVQVGGYGSSDRTGTITFASGSSLTAGSVTLGNAGAIPAPGVITMTAGATLSVGGAITVNTVYGNTWTPGTGTVILMGSSTLPATIFTTNNNLTIGGSTALAVDLTIRGTLTLNSTLTVGAHTLTLNGPTIAGTPSNLSTTSSSSLVFGGSSTGVVIPSSVTALSGLTINNTYGVTLNSSPTISGTLTLLGGTFAVGAHTLTLNGPAIAGAPSTFSTTSSSSLVFGGSSTGVAIPGNVKALSGLTIGNPNGVTLNGSPTISGTLTLQSGTFAIGTNTLTLNGPAIAGAPANLSTTSDSGLTFGGSAMGVNLPSSVTVLNYLTINNANGVTLNSSPTISSGLTLTSGNIITGANTLFISNTYNNPIGKASSYVNGNLQKAFATGSGQSFTFPVGDASRYTPVALANMAVDTAGTLTAKTTAGQHPQIAGSGINSAKDVARYWTLTASGLVPSTCDVTCTFDSTDVIGGADTAKFVVRRYNASAWSSTTAGTRTTTSTQAAGLASFGDLAVGECLVSAAQSTLTASPTLLTADGSTTATITVTLKDASGNPVAGKAVSLAMTSGAGTPTITTIAGTTDANGRGSWTVKSTTAGVDVFRALDSTDNITVTQTATVTFFTHCAAGDVTAAPAWYIDDNNRVVITLCDSYGLGRVQALRLTNCTMTAQAYNATGSVLGSALSLTDPDHGGGYVPLPNGTVKVVCLASLIPPNTTGSCNAQAQDMCGLFSATADPVMTRLTIAGGGETQQILTGISSAERLLRVQNGTPGLTRLAVVVNGYSYVLAPLNDGASLSLDVGAMMIPGDGNTVVLLGEGAEGASATVTLGDSHVGDPMIVVNPMALQIAGSAQGVQLSWPSTATAAGYLLQSRPSLAPSDAWVIWPAAPESINGRWVMTVPAEGSARLFRLYKP
jgi:hypothetical protein